MKLVKSTALKKFKKEVGQANHFLITILIGLDGVKSGNVTKNDLFDAAWNPKSVDASVERSRIYAIKSGLTWIVDCFDMYLRLCNRKPRLLSSELSSKFDRTGHSVYQKYKLVISEYELPKLEVAVVDLLICWRNKMVHFDADNDILESNRNYFLNEMKNEDIVKKYHLDIDQMIEGFNSGRSPRFKEITFMTGRVIAFVECLDKKLIANLDELSFLKSTLSYKLSHDQASLNGIFVMTGNKRRKKLIQFLKNCGFTDIDDNSSVVDEYIDYLCELPYAEVSENL